MLPVFKKAQLLTHTANGLPGVRWCLKGCKTLFRDARGRGSRTSGARLGGPPGRRGDRLWAGPGSSLASRCGSGAGRVRPGPRVRSARGGCRFNWRISPVGWLGVGLLEGPPYRTVPGRAWGCRAGRGLAPRGAARGGVSSISPPRKNAPAGRPGAKSRRSGGGFDAFARWVTLRVCSASAASPSSSQRQSASLRNRTGGWASVGIA